MRVGKQKHLIVDPTQSLCDILNGKTIVEYPTFVVILSSNLPQYDLITKAELQQDQAKRMTKYSRSNAKSDTTWIAKESAKEMSIEKSEPKQDDTLIETVSQTGDTKPVSLISSVHFSDENSDYSDGEIRDESEDEAGPTEVSIKAVVEQWLHLYLWKVCS